MEKTESHGEWVSTTHFMFKLKNKVVCPRIAGFNRGCRNGTCACQASRDWGAYRQCAEEDALSQDIRNGDVHHVSPTIQPPQTEFQTVAIGCPGTGVCVHAWCGL